MLDVDNTYFTLLTLAGRSATSTTPPHPEDRQLRLDQRDDRDRPHRRLQLIAATSTAAHGTVSRVVPHLEGPVTAPRIDTHRIVTEYGKTTIKGLSSTERAHALIGLVHPEFRDEPTAAARDQHLI